MGGRDGLIIWSFSSPIQLLPYSIISFLFPISYQYLSMHLVDCIFDKGRLQAKKKYHPGRLTEFDFIWFGILRTRVYGREIMGGLKRFLSF